MSTPNDSIGIAQGLCGCGCGRPTLIANRGRTKRGQRKGHPLRFVNGHNTASHRSSFTPEYQAFHDAKGRCSNKIHKSYKNYGGRGIKFLFTSFKEFLNHIGLKPSPDLTLDRINNDGHYEIGNVRWATRKTQRSNQRNHHEPNC